MSQSSYRTILRASSIIGSASVINIVAGLIKMKFAAVLLGPVGVGLIGLYQSLMQTSAAVASLGMTSAGTRRIAAVTQDDSAMVALVRRALLWGTLVQALVGGLVFWLLSGALSQGILESPDRTDEVAWLALGVALMVGAGAQTALLTGLRRIGDIARIQVGGGLLGAAGGVTALWAWGEGGLLVMVLVAPLSTFILGHLCVFRLTHKQDTSPLPVVVREWGGMAWLGLALMISTVITMAGHLIVRVMVQRDLGTEALGQFQAAWTIGMTYLTFILGAMGTDYYPRLSAVINDKTEATKLVNQQTEVTLLLTGPLLLAMMGCTPLVIRLLYTAEFDVANDILRWQLLGDILKLMSWPLGFVLLASGAGRMFIFTEFTGVGIFVLGVTLGLPLIGLAATGIAFIALYAIYLPLVCWLGGRCIDFRWSRTVVLQAITITFMTLAVMVIAGMSEFLGVVIGLGAAFVLGLWSIFRLSSASGAVGRLGALVRVGERVQEWIRTR